MKNPNLNRFEIKSAEDIHTHIQNQKNISNYHLLELVKKTFTNILVLSMWTISMAFLFYILRFLYLTAFTTEQEMITRMQDIMVKLFGWILFVASQAGLIKSEHKNKEN